MTDFVFLPNPRVRFTMPDDTLTMEAYRALQGLQVNLQGQIDDLAAVIADIVALNTDVTALDASKADKSLIVTGSGSVQRVGGTDLSETVIFSLVNDITIPGPNLVYGSDSAGTKGWFPQGMIELAHNDLNDLQGGTADEYYHLTATQHTPIAQIGDLADPGADSLLAWNNTSNLYDYRTIGVANADEIPTVGDADARYDAIGAAAAALVAANDYTDDEIAALSTVYQPLDATLTALAGLNSTPGLVEQTGADAFTKRAIGVASATDILTRADGDGRYDALGDAAAALVSANAYTDAEIAERFPTDPPFGQWTPTATLGTNAAAATPQLSNWLRVGNMVTGSIRLTAQASSGSAGTPVGTIIELSLPIASDLTATSNAGGAGTVAEVPYVPVLLQAETTNNRLQVAWYATSTSTRSINLSFTYYVQ